MEIVWTILGIMAWLAVIGCIAYLVFAWIRRGRTTEVDAGIGVPRRFYFYSISFIALMMLASGVMITFSTLLDGLAGDRVVLRSETTKLASGLALIIVGLPLWGFHWRFVERSASDLPVERRTILRVLYLYVTLGVALGFMAFNGVRLIEFALRVREFSGLDPSALVVWGLIWAYHWRVISSGGPESTLETRGIRRLYLYLASALGVAMLATGAGWLVYLVLQEGYSATFADLVLDPAPTGLASDALRSSAALALVGGAIWWSHWLRFAGPDRGSVLRWIYLFAASIGGGAVTAQVGFGLVLYEVISWIIREPDSVASPFEGLPAALATAVVGVAMWAYFRRRMDTEAEGAVRVLVRRINDYLLVGGGLMVLAVATASVLDTSIRLFTESSSATLQGEVQWRFRAALILTLAVVGLPTWWRHWRRIEAAAAPDPVAERTSLPRKLYVLTVLCLGLLSLVGGASATIFMFLRDLLAVDLSIDTLRDLTSALAVVLTTAVILPYHWIVYRNDRELEPDSESPPTPVRKHVTLLTPPGGGNLVRAVEEALGQSITLAPWSDHDAYVPSLDPDELTRVAQAVAAANGSQVLLIPEPTTLRIISHG